MFRQAAQEYPKVSEILSNLAKALKKAGVIEEATEKLTQALAINSNPVDAQLLSIWLASGAKPNLKKLNAKGLLSAISYKTIDRQPIIRVSAEFMKIQFPIAPAFTCGRKEGWESAAKWFLSAGGKAAHGNQLLLTCLQSEPICDLDFENFFTAVRRILLLQLPKQQSLKNSIQTFIISLITQCQLNEHIYSISPEEIQELKILNSQDNDSWKFLILALYQELDSLFINSLDYKKYSSGPLSDLIQTEQKKKEAELKFTLNLGSLGKIATSHSKDIKNFYEETPYPRWQSVHLMPGQRRSILERFISKTDLSYMDGLLDVLVAGCGTGQQLIEAAAGYGENANIVAFDVSRNSLGYAARMANEFGFNNIHFAEGDILKLQRLNKIFDIIECIGVLHHLAEPFVGWEQLIKYLRVDGHMRLGLYSRSARKEISRLRKNMRTGHLPNNRSDIRVARRSLIESKTLESCNGILESPDFFSLSNVRDLLFHIHEKPVSLAEIAKFMVDLKLDFVGFEIAPKIELLFDQEEGKSKRANIKNWVSFEKRYPNIFQGMYIFWCRRYD